MDDQSIVEGLADLGFSQYEARAYVGLVGQQPLTGYALSNRTQIPQPKVYETLRRLEEKHAVVRTGSDPARFVAVPPEQLISSIGDDYRRRLEDVRTGLSQLRSEDDADALRVLDSPRSWQGICASALQLLENAQRHVYLSGHADQFEPLAAALVDADARGVRCDVLCFGRAPVQLPNGRVLEHSSTDGVIYRHHQARHIAVVVDSAHALWGLAADGRTWDAMAGHDPLLAAVVKGYIRHDVYVQQIFVDFRDALVDRYGPSLEDLVVPTVDAPPEVARKTSRRSARKAG